jgi:hypothetical protein
MLFTAQECDTLIIVSGPVPNRRQEERALVERRHLS